MDHIPDAVFKEQMFYHLAPEIRKILTYVYNRYDNDESFDITPEAMKVLGDALDIAYSMLVVADDKRLSNYVNNKDAVISDRPF